MVMALVEVLAGQRAAVKHDYMDAVRRAVCSCLRMRDDDPASRLIEHDFSDFAGPPCVTARYTKVAVTVFEGRALDAKRGLHHSLVAELASLGVPAYDMQVVVREPPVKTWSLGGTPANDVDPGFRDPNLNDLGRPPASCVPDSRRWQPGRPSRLGDCQRARQLTGPLVLRPAD